MRASVILMICGIILTASVMAQPREEMKMRSGRPMERLDRYKKIRMVETLNLDEETGIKLVSRYGKHRERMKELDSDRSALADKLESLTKNNASDAEYQRIFAEFHDLEKKSIETRKKFLEDLKEILSNKQIAEYMLFERDFMKDVRNVVKDVQKERQRRN
jgi:hypothetical protein